MISSVKGISCGKILSLGAKFLEGGAEPFSSIISVVAT
jgi:hypothetical protein